VLRFCNIATSDFPGFPAVAPRQDALRWALDIAEALEYLHGLRPLIVHRDLKLENILLTATNPARSAAKLADFGLHKMIKDVASGVPLAETNDQVCTLDLSIMQVCNVCSE